MSDTNILKIRIPTKYTSFYQVGQRLSIRGPDNHLISGTVTILERTQIDKYNNYTDVTIKLDQMNNIVLKSIMHGISIGVEK